MANHVRRTTYIFTSLQRLLTLHAEKDAVAEGEDRRDVMFAHATDVATYVAKDVFEV